MNKGVLKGTNSDGSNPTNSEKNTATGQDSLVLGAKRFFVDRLTPNASSQLKNFVDQPSAGSHQNPELYTVSTSSPAPYLNDWTTQTSQFASGYPIYSVAYGNGLWMAGGGWSGSTPAPIRISTDAVTWVTHTSLFGNLNQVRSIAYANGLWVAGGASGTLLTLDSTKSQLPSIFFGNNIWGWIKK